MLLPIENDNVWGLKRFFEISFEWLAAEHMSFVYNRRNSCFLWFCRRSNGLVFGLDGGTHMRCSCCARVCVWVYRMVENMGNGDWLESWSMEPTNVWRCMGGLVLGAAAIRLVWNLHWLRPIGASFLFPFWLTKRDSVKAIILWFIEKMTVKG